MNTKANTYGKLLLELCKKTDLIIANGGIYQDKHRGSFTYYNRNGKSVIEYMLFDPNCYNMITDFDQYKISLQRDECNNIIDQLILNANTDRSSDYICSLIHKRITTASSGILKKSQYYLK